MRTLAVANQKGGCGKTTTAINLAAVYARRGMRTLLVDIDPQSHCAAGLGVPEERVDYSIGEALISRQPESIDRTRLIWEVARNLDLIPSTMRLATLEAPGGGLHDLPEKDARLSRVLEQFAPHYDRCVIDCPPNIGLLTFSAMRASREVLIPVETGYFSLKGAEKQWETIQRVIQRIGRPIACHIVATMHDEESDFSCDILASLRRRFAGQILPIVIHHRIELKEAASLGQAITEYAPETAAYQDFETLADWLDQHESRPQVEVEVLISHDEAMEDSGISDAAAPSIAPCARASMGEWEQAHGRAAELVRRLRNPVELEAAKLPAYSPVVSTPSRAQHSPSETTVHNLSVDESVESLSPADGLDASAVSHLYGVTATSRGLLFVQPLSIGRHVAVAGEFNHWSPTAAPLRPNRDLAVFETVIPLPPGRYAYRIVVDGQWMADPHNPLSERNQHGEENSVILAPQSVLLDDTQSESHAECSVQ